MSTFEGFSFEVSGTWLHPATIDQSKQTIKSDIATILAPKPSCQFPVRENTLQQAHVTINRGQEIRDKQFLSYLPAIVQRIGYHIQVARLKYGQCDKNLLELNKHMSAQHLSTLISTSDFNLVSILEEIAHALPHQLQQLVVEQVDENVSVDIVTFNAMHTLWGLEEIFNRFGSIQWDQRDWQKR